MTVIDSRDFNRGGVPTASPIGNQGLYSGGSASSGFLLTDQYDKIMLSFINTDPTSYFLITPGWTYSGGGTPQAGTAPVVFGPNQVGQALFDVQAPLVNISSVLKSGAIVSGATFDVVGIKGNVDRYGLRSEKTPLQADISSYTANQSKTFAMNYWYEGMVLVTLGAQTAGGGYVSFRYWDATALAFKEYCTISLVVTTSGMPTRIVLPPFPVQAVVNNGGTAQLIGFEVVPIPN